MTYICCPLGFAILAQESRIERSAMSAKPKKTPSPVTLLCRATNKVIRLEAGMALRKEAEKKRRAKYDKAMGKMSTELSKAEAEVKRLTPKKEPTLGELMDNA